MNRILSFPKSVIRFIREIAAELKLVNWISRKKVGQFTIVVLILTVLTVGIVTGMDGLLVAVRGLMLGRF